MYVKNIKLLDKEANAPFHPHQTVAAAHLQGDM